MERGQGRSFIAGVAIMLVVAAMIVYGGSWSLHNCEGMRVPRMGARAPAFSLPTPGGKKLALASLRGKVVVLDFWAAWCGPCLRKMPHLEKLQAELKKDGLTVVAINIEGDVEAVKRFSERHQSKVTMVVDNGSVARRYGVQTLPHVVVVGRGGKLIFAQTGSRGVARLRERVKLALKQPP